MVRPVEPGHPFLWVGNNSCFCDIINSHLNFILKTVRLPFNEVLGCVSLPVLPVFLLCAVCRVRHCGFTYTHVRAVLVSDFKECPVKDMQIIADGETGGL